MTVSIIAAIGRNREIGKDNVLLWHLPADMQFFRETTYWHHVVMGRKNYESIPSKYRPLVDRTNIVLSRNPDYEAPECFVVTSLNEALQIALDYEEPETFIIGGGEVYKEALNNSIVDCMYITHIDEDFPDADTFFPAFNEQDWTRELLLDFQRDVSNVIGFQIFRYDKKIPSEQL
ncbi:MAG: dihydrofolate reductase [Flavobacteriales bacterium]|nr:dihydrofolate reductase [Flavobacteriales bacterium]